MDGDVILSQEGTTQGDPLAMPMYGLVTIPLIRRLDGACKQVWYVDDSAAIEKIHQLREWWNKLADCGPAFGYFLNPSKTWLVSNQNILVKLLECLQTQALTTHLKADRTFAEPMGCRITSITM